MSRDSKSSFSYVLLSSGNKYHLYEFKHQPSHEECVQMTRSSPSLLFAQYTNLFCDNTWEEFLTELFGSSGKAQVSLIFVMTCACVSLTSSHCPSTFSRQSLHRTALHQQGLAWHPSVSRRCHGGTSPP